MEQLVDEVKNVDLLYHESTFMHDLLDRARATFHSTSVEAATIALKASVGKLVIGHFSLQKVKNRGIIPRYHLYRENHYPD
jgi:ribonuclease Z